MMKHFYLVAVLLVLSKGAFSQAPDWAWISESKGTGAETGRDVAVDAAGNVYVVGTFDSPVFSAGSATFANSGTAGTGEVFLLKYDRTGALLWARRGSGSEEDVGMSVTTDGSGNVYITGWFQSPSITFGSLTVNNYTTSGFEDIFVVKYNSSGTVMWAKAWGSTQQEFAYSIAADQAGNTYVTGDFYSLSVLFGNYGLINSGVSDVFVVKLDPSGTPQWAKKIGGGNIDYGRDVATDAAGSVYIIGSYNSGSIASFSPSLTNAGGFDVFYAKYDGAGNNLLSGKIGASGDEFGYAIATGTAGQYFMMGNFQSASLQFGSTTLSNASGSDMYFTKYAASGSALWAQRSAGSQAVTWGDLLTDGAGDLYAAGAYNQASLSFGSITINAGGSYDGYVVKFNGSSGSPIWARTTGSPGLEQLFGIALGGGYLHLSGMYSGTLAMGAHALAAQGGTDGFVTKMCNAPAPPTAAKGTTVCPNAIGVLTATTPPGTTASWFAAGTGGAALLSGSLSFTAGVAGTYYVASKDTNSGCAMVSYSRLAVNLGHFPPINPTVTVSGNTLIASGQGMVQYWYNCGQNTVISGQTTPSFVITASGSYAVIMTANGCADTSLCNSYVYTPGKDTLIITTGIPHEETGSSFSLYPNPAAGAITVRSSRTEMLLVTDVLGNIVAEFMAREEEAVRFDTAILPAGVYYVRSGRSGAGAAFILQR
jgi:hypothetical protein